MMRPTAIVRHVKLDIARSNYVGFGTIFMLILQQNVTNPAECFDIVLNGKIVDENECISSFVNDGEITFALNVHVGNVWNT